ncbi:ubiquitin associated and SH3 domain-containing protein B, partial [Aphelenchoides avenae]
TSDTTDDDTTGGTTTTSTRTETSGTEDAPTGTSATELSTTQGDAASVRDPAPRKPAEKPKEPAPRKLQDEVKTTVMKPIARARVCKRLILLARNAEQMDKLFPDWCTKNFVDGKYVPTDLNHPRFLPVRRNPATAYHLDPPLTEIGARMAEMMGQALAAKGVEFSAVYSSPALRCIQTAQYLLKGQRNPSKIRVENALYEFCGAKDSVSVRIRAEPEQLPELSFLQFLPHFLDGEEMEANQIPVDRGYRSNMPESDMAQLVGMETPEQFSKRSSEVVKKISKYHSTVGAVLIVTHAPVMHSGGRSMCRKRTDNVVSPSELQRIAFHYPYCSMIALEATSEAGGWKQCPGVVPQMRFDHYSNRFNHAYFDRKE